MSKMRLFTSHMKTYILTERKNHKLKIKDIPLKTYTMSHCPSTSSTINTSETISLKQSKLSNVNYAKRVQT